MFFIDFAGQLSYTINEKRGKKMVKFPNDYRIRPERNFFVDCLVNERLQDFQKQLPQACIDLGWKHDGQIIDDMFTEKYHIWRVYDTDGGTKYKLKSGSNNFFVEREDYVQKIDDLFRKRNAPLMHFKYMWHSIKNPPLGMNMVASTILAVIELPYSLKMCRLNKTR